MSKEEIDLIDQLAGLKWSVRNKTGRGYPSAPPPNGAKELCISLEHFGALSSVGKLFVQRAADLDLVSRGGRTPGFFVTSPTLEGEIIARTNEEVGAQVLQRDGWLFVR